MITSATPKEWRNSIKGVALNHLPGVETCAEIDARIVVYLDDELSMAERICFKVHLAICRECREFLRAYWNSLLLARLVLETSAEPVGRDGAEAVIAAIIKERSRQDPAGW